MAYGRVNVIGLSKTKEREYQRKVANLSAVADIYDNRTVGATGVWYDLLDGTNDYSEGKLDDTSTRATQALTAGTTILTDKVESTSGFKIGQEVTIQDDVNKETATVTKADLTESTLFDHTTPIEVVGSAFTTSASARPQVLSNGWIVTCVLDNANSKLIYYVDKNDGNGFIQLTEKIVTTINTWAMVSYKTHIYQIRGFGNNAMSFDSFDALNPTVVTSGWLDAQNQTAIGDCSLTISNDGTKICGAWASKNSTYPNSFNIRAVQGTISSDMITWGSVEQVTAVNDSSLHLESPSIDYKSDGYPIICFKQEYPTFRQIVCNPNTVSGWGTTSQGREIITYNGATYAQDSPQIITQRYGANIGRIWCVWYGTDSTDTTIDNIRTKYSDDNGATWINGGTSNEKLTSGNTYYQRYATITEDKNGDMYIAWSGRDIDSANYRIKMIKRTGDTWGIIENVTTKIMDYPSMCSNHADFEKPIMIWRDTTNTRIAFYGKYTITAFNPYLEVTALTKAYKKYASVYRSNVVLDTTSKAMKIGNFVDDAQNIPLLNSDVRYNITPESPSNEIVAWVDHEDDVGFSIDAELSIVTGSANEVYSPMARTINDLGETHEDEFVGVKSTKGDNVTVKFTLTRTDTGIDKSVTKVLGAIGE